MDIVVDVLQWIIIILIAGFIGQFGKSLSLQLLDYYKKKKEKRNSADPSVPSEDEHKPSLSPIKDTPAEKESSIVPQVKDSPVEKDFALEPQEKDDKTLKKALKAQQKVKKKMEKAKQKEPK